MNPDKPVRIIRAKHDNEYFASSRKTAQDDSLSWAARGVLWYLLSKSDTWELNPKDLEQGCGRDKVYEIIGELLDHGYAKRVDTIEKGKHIDTTYEVYEHALPEDQRTKRRTKKKPLPEKPDTVLPDTVKPESEKPDTEKPQIREYETLESTDQKDSAPKNGAEAVSDQPVAVVQKVSDGIGANEEPEKQKQARSKKSEPDVPKKPKEPKQRDPIFDAVTLHIFGIESDEELRNMDAEEQSASRIGKIASWLSGKNDRFSSGNSKKKTVFGFISAPANPDHVEKFAAYCKKEGYTPPNDIEKFINHWRKWASTQKITAVQLNYHRELQQRKNAERKRELKLDKQPVKVSA